MEYLIKHVRNKIVRLSKEFNFRYGPKVFAVSVVPKNDFVKLLYLIGCPLEEYAKFGKTIGERIKNYNKFSNSKEFSELVRETGGTLVIKEYVEENIENIRSKELREELKGLLDKIVEKADLGVDYIAVITEPKNRKEAKFVFGTVLFHEWIHALLQYNNIFFQRIDQKYMGFDEGLTEYLYLFLSRENKDFEKQIMTRLAKRRSKGKDKKFSKYMENVFDKLLFWNGVLKYKKTPKERYESIKNVMKKLKKQ